jgi:hypothetical protein
VSDDFDFELGAKTKRPPGDSGNKANDFTNALAQMGIGSGQFKEEIPPLFPAYKQDGRDLETVPDPLAPQAKAKRPDYEAHYKRFDLSADSDRLDLEEIMGHVMKDGWLMAREEWVHAKDGNTYVILKYLVRKKEDAT